MLMTWLQMLLRIVHDDDIFLRWQELWRFLANLHNLSKSAYLAISSGFFEDIGKHLQPLPLSCQKSNIIYVSISNVLPKPLGSAMTTCRKRGHWLRRSLESFPNGIAIMKHAQLEHPQFDLGSILIVFHRHSGAEEGVEASEVSFSRRKSVLRAAATASQSFVQ